MKCHNCGQPLAPDAKFCGSCGALVHPNPVPSPVSSTPPMTPPAGVPVGLPPSPMPGQTAPPYAAGQVPGPANPFAGQISNKGFMTTFLLSIFLGWLGVDRFYTGQVGLGILKLVTFGGCGLWQLIDTILILAGSRKDKFGRELYGRQKDFKTALIIFIVLTALGTIGGTVSSFMRSYNAIKNPPASTSTQSDSNSGSTTVSQ